MKRVLLLFCLSVLFIVAGAQTARKKYYAIDGSEWVTKHDRDKKERLLWEKIDVDLKAALVSGRFGNDVDQAKIYHDNFKKLFNMCRESVETLRKADVGNEIMQNAEFRFYLSENGVEARPKEARSKEVFNFEEYGRCFDEVLREYSFNAEIVSELANPVGRTYNLNFVVSDFTDRMKLVLNNIERELLAMEYKEATVKRLIPRYEAAKKTIEQKEKRKNEKRRQK